MPQLLRRPIASHGKIHEITPQAAGWRHVGFDLWRLSPGDRIYDKLQGREAILVFVEGKGRVRVGDTEFGELGDRLNVFQKRPPHCVYVPLDRCWQVDTTTDCLLAVCSAPASTTRPAQLLGPAGLQMETRGTGTNLRHIQNIAMEGRDVADSLLVTEVFTPAGHWSSYPPHRHDEDDFPRITYLEETYYHRLNPASGFGIQRVYTEDGDLDETMALSDHDVVLVPRGHHPCAAPYGVEMYYLNVMAGPRRNWRFQTDPDFERLMA